MNKLFLALSVFLVASAGQANEKPADPQHMHDPYVLVSPVRLKQLVGALETKEKIELLLGASAVEIENGFHTYYLIPRTDLDLFPGCVATVRIKYAANIAKEIAIEDEASKPSVTRASRFKDQGMMVVVEGWLERQKRIEAEALKSLNEPGSSGSSKVKDETREKEK